MRDERDLVKKINKGLNLNEYYTWIECKKK